MPLPRHAVFICTLIPDSNIAIWAEDGLKKAFGQDVVFRDSMAVRDLTLRWAMEEAQVAVVVIGPTGVTAEDNGRSGGEPHDRLTSSDVINKLFRHKRSSAESLIVIPLLTDVTDLRKLEGLPKELTLLQARDCQIFESNDPYGSLNRLVDCIGQTFSEALVKGLLDTMITELDLAGLRLKRLPESIGQLSQLRHLKASSNHLTELPEALGGLAQLQHLNIAGNRLTELPDFLSKLSQLQYLDVNSNHLTALPDSLANLSQLRVLDISNNQLTKLPDSVGKLAGLYSLKASRNKLTLLPTAVSQLLKLQHLDVSNNELSSLPDLMGRLASLWNLNVSNNQLQALPDSLSQLWRLQILNAAMNKLTALPDSLGALVRLEILCVSDNELMELPASVKKLSVLKELYLQRNDGLGIPAEVLGPGLLEELPERRLADPASILDYYFLRLHGRPLNEVKLILVGRGGVGKTSLVKRLVHGTFNEQEPETPGINIEPWEIAVSDGDQVRLHVWDFGGQRILHGTHQFFLTERTVYLLVLSGREDSATQDAEYWLQLIKSFGGQSRVIIALNKMREHPFDVNRGLLLEKYPFIADFVQTDCKDPTMGVEDLRELIRAQTDTLEHRKTAFPADWFSIKDQLATMSENFITWDDYQQICRDHGETNAQAQRDLARFLHILGIALNYAEDPRLRDTRVLRPTWVTDGIYTLLRALQHENNGGVLNPGDLNNALDSEEYPPAKHDFLVRLMEKFQLCFRLSGKQESYLVPELLDENQPDLRELLETAGLAFRYQYEVLPEGLLPRFIVQTHVHSATNPQWRWRTGVVVNRDGCRAVVRADVRERRVDVHVVGPEALRRGVLAVVRAAFDEQHRDLKGLIVDERIPIPGELGVTESYRHLLQLEEEGEDWCRPSGAKERHRVKDLLNGVETQESRAQKRSYDKARERLGGRDATREAENRVTKTVIELDLVGYSIICENLEQGLDVTTVAQLNQQIQSFIDAGLNEVKAERGQTVMKTTGDGAILVFDSAADAHDFAQAVQEVTREHNARRQQPIAKRVFRVGAATGEIVMTANPDGSYEIAGSTIARAVRLERKARPGGLLVDPETLSGMEPRQRALYGPRRVVAGKRDEKFEAVACQLNLDGPKDASFFGSARKHSRRSILRKLSNRRRH